MGGKIFYRLFSRIPPAAGRGVLREEQFDFGASGADKAVGVVEGKVLGAGAMGDENGPGALHPGAAVDEDLCVLVGEGVSEEGVSRVEMGR